MNRNRPSLHVHLAVLFVFAAGREKKLLSQVSVGATIYATPVAANGVLYVASQQYLWAVRQPSAAEGKP